MKKILAMILMAMMILSAAVCAENAETEVRKLGKLQSGVMKIQNDEEHIAHVKKEFNEASDVVIEHINYDNLSAALLDLKNGKLFSIGLEGCAAKYVAARNEEIEITYGQRMTDFSMLVMEENKEVYDAFNNAIIAMKADGTLDSLIENDLKAYIESDPEPKDLPVFEGAKTVKVGVTGDLPPMDFVAANGKAAGFNVALLTEIANRAQLNIELVHIETGARPMALASGRVDVVFWARGIECEVCKEIEAEEIPGTLVTESYFSDSAVGITLKTEN